MRVPGTINSKCAQEIKIVQLWDGQRPAINYLLRDFTRWLINKKLMQRLVGSRKEAHKFNYDLMDRKTITNSNR